MSGVFGIVSQKDCLQDLFYGTDYHSHLGTEFGGMAVMGDKLIRQIHNISQSQFKSKFFDDYHKMSGNKGIGAISDSDEQPIYLDSKFGPFSIVTTGLIENKVFLKDYVFKNSMSFSEISYDIVNTTELIAKIISSGDSLVDGIEKMFELIEGSCSLLILSPQGIFAARDRRGYTPLVIGRREKDWVVASESSALPNLGFEIYKYLLPGEIVLLSEKGLEEQSPGQESQQICSFLWIYTGFPASCYEGINVEQAREECGRALARRDRDIEVDVVSGVPDSGSAHAIGYAMESGKPYRRPLIKYTPGYGRSYTPPSQETRDLVAKMKLIPIASIIKDNRIVVCDDSIVRGTQLKNFTVNKLWDCGANEVHIRPACPPLMFPCKFCLSTRSIQELVARRAIRALEGKDPQDISEYLDESSLKYQQMVDWIANDLKVTTLRYQRIDDMVKAIGLSKEKLCLYCWNGQCPQARETKGSTKKKDEKVCESSK